MKREAIDKLGRRDKVVNMFMCRELKKIGNPGTLGEENYTKPNNDETIPS